MIRLARVGGPAAYSLLRTANTGLAGWVAHPRSVVAAVWQPWRTSSSWRSGISLSTMVRHLRSPFLLSFEVVPTDRASSHRRPDCVRVVPGYRRSQHLHVRAPLNLPVNLESADSRELDRWGSRSTPPPGVAAAHLDVKITASRLQVGLKGNPPFLNVRCSKGATCCTNLSGAATTLHTTWVFVSCRKTSHAKLRKMKASGR